VLALVAAPIVLLTAAASWHLVERPALLWRKNWSIAGRQAAQAALSRAEQGPPPAS
jgi:peptidoglycan/LPS O-acetylase OafA/YrhL